MTMATTMTPGRAAHDAWCADDDWDKLTPAERQAWEDSAQAGHAEIVRQETARAS
jgi:hypothetical protein